VVEEVVTLPQYLVVVEVEEREKVVLHSITVTLPSRGSDLCGKHKTRG
jgi:hypothetical protein